MASTLFAIASSLFVELAITSRVARLTSYSVALQVLVKVAKFWKNGVLKAAVEVCHTLPSNQIAIQFGLSIDLADCIDWTIRFERVLESIVQIRKVMSYKIDLYKVEFENGVFEELDQSFRKSDGENEGIDF
ncbi:hypothetical protein MTR_1g036320 [Medicago truncatula]|uniref:Uncharacterized protein n=1 Tax=Medicago truncatula TaxID=3880 RepID=A0A072VGZ6_MEDTR|nr:hypothetical protein MTR_1g036320 [Medicago truncatula]